jgi:hypothetical protein
MSSSPKAPGTALGFPLYYGTEAELLSANIANGRSAFAADTQKLYLRASGSWGQIETAGGTNNFAVLDQENVFTEKNTFRLSGATAPSNLNSAILLQNDNAPDDSVNLELRSGNLASANVVFSSSSQEAEGILAYAPGIRSMIFVAADGDGGPQMYFNANGLGIGSTCDVKYALNIDGQYGFFGLPVLPTSDKSFVNPQQGLSCYDVDQQCLNVFTRIQVNNNNEDIYAQIGQPRYNLRHKNILTDLITVDNITQNNANEIQMSISGSLSGGSGNTKLYMRPSGDTLGTYESLLIRTTGLSTLTDVDTTGLMITQKTSSGNMNFYGTITFNYSDLGGLYYKSELTVKTESSKAALHEGAGFWEPGTPFLYIEFVLSEAATLNGEVITYSRNY